MLKDILVHLATGIKDDAAVDYAIWLASAFDAHLAGAAFANDEVPPALLANGVPPPWIDEYREQAQAAAQLAVSSFEAAARRAGISAQAGCLRESVTDARADLPVWQGASTCRWSGELRLTGAISPLSLSRRRCSKRADQSWSCRPRQERGSSSIT